MFGFDKVEMQGRLIAMVGALVFSTIFVGAAVGPVQPAQFASAIEAPANAVANV